jgi:hypothetical protein
MKGWRTILANLLFAVLPVLELTELRAVIPPAWLPWYALGVVLANMVLRAVTSTKMGRGK